MANTLKAAEEALEKLMARSPGLRQEVIATLSLPSGSAASQALFAVRGTHAPFQIVDLRFHSTLATLIRREDGIEQWEIRRWTT